MRIAALFTAHILTCFSRCFPNQFSILHPGFLLFTTYYLNNSIAVYPLILFSYINIIMISTPLIFFQLFTHSRSYRIQMYVQTYNITIIFICNRDALITTLKKMSATFMGTVVINTTSGLYPLHSP